MKTRVISMLLITILVGSLLSACSSKDDANNMNATAGTEVTATPEKSPETSPEAEASTTPETAPSEEPTATTAPSPTAEPEASKEPAATKKPTATKEPVPTKKPAATKAPAPTNKPAATKEPVPTKKPTPTKPPVAETLPNATKIVDGMLEKVEQPSLMTMDSDSLKDMYSIDSSLLEDYSVRYPMMNVKATEIAVFKVKNKKDIDTIKDGIKTRATTIQKNFEHYLPDQYENALNYTVTTNGNYVLFIISDKADDLKKAFNSYFEKK